MVAQDGACVVCNDISTSNEAMTGVTKVTAENPALPTQDKDSRVQFETEEKHGLELTPSDCSESEGSSDIGSTLDDDREKGRKRLKSFRPAPDLLRHTAVDFWPARLELRCCEECGHCAAYLSTRLGVNWLDGWDWYCPWHWSGNAEDCEVNPEDGEVSPGWEAYSVQPDWDEVEEVAEAWDERLLNSGRLALSQKSTRRSRGSGKTSWVHKDRRKERRFETIMQNGPAVSSTILGRGAKHDVTSRVRAKHERLAEAVAARKANIEGRLERANRPRRGPPTNIDRPRCNETQPKPATAKTKTKTARVKFELKEEDATRFAASDEEAALLKVLALLQHRDLLPEDYDLLLRLDEKVSKRTVNSGRLKTLETRCLSDDDLTTNSDLACARCAVCMDSFCAGQVVKSLPCQHIFHSNCIDTWLTNSSSTCPLDGIEV